VFVPSTELRERQTPQPPATAVFHPKFDG